MITLPNLLILALAVYRLSLLLADEDGPLDMFIILRIKAGMKYDAHGNPYGSNELSRGMMCQWCNSIWLGIAAAALFYFAPMVVLWLCLPLALSAVTVLVTKFEGEG